MLRLVRHWSSFIKIFLLWKESRFAVTTIQLTTSGISDKASELERKQTLVERRLVERRWVSRRLSTHYYSAVTTLLARINSLSVFQVNSLQLRGQILRCYLIRMVGVMFSSWEASSVPEGSCSGKTCEDISILHLHLSPVGVLARMLNFVFIRKCQ